MCASWSPESPGRISSSPPPASSHTSPGVRNPRAIPALGWGHWGQKMGPLTWGAMAAAAVGGGDGNYLPPISLFLLFVSVLLCHHQAPPLAPQDFWGPHAIQDIWGLFAVPSLWQGGIGAQRNDQRCPKVSHGDTWGAQGEAQVHQSGRRWVQLRHRCGRKQVTAVFRQKRDGYEN